MTVPNSSVSPVGIRVRWYYVFFLTLKNCCKISQGSIQDPRPVSVCTQFKLLPCLRKLLHALSNRKLHCLLGTVTDCSVALVEAEHKGRSKGTPPLSWWETVSLSWTESWADYKDLLMSATEKAESKRGDWEIVLSWCIYRAAASSWGVTSQVGRGWNAGIGCSWDDYF